MNKDTKWPFAGACVIGTQHEKSEGRCEDARAYRSAPNGIALAYSVSDGAGSARYGYKGAKIVSRVVAEWLSRHFDFARSAPLEDLRSTLYRQLHKALSRASIKENCQMKDLACTLIGAVAGANGEWVAVHLGDGGIVARVGDVVGVLSMPMKGEFANQSHFATDADALYHIYVYRSETTKPLSRPNALVLFTDGLENVLVNRRSGRIAGATLKMLSWLDSYPPPVVNKAIKSNLLETMRLHSGDDCTLVLLSGPRQAV